MSAEQPAGPAPTGPAPAFTPPTFTPQDALTGAGRPTAGDFATESPQMPESEPKCGPARPPGTAKGDKGEPTTPAPTPRAPGRGGPTPSPSPSPASDESAIPAPSPTLTRAGRRFLPAPASAPDESAIPAPPPAPTRAGRRFLPTTLALLAAFGIWATVAELDVVSNASGEVVPATRVKAIQHLEGGIVREILVEEGALVARGQPLIHLDPIRARAERAELARRIVSLRLEVARLTAESQAADHLELPPDLEQAAPGLAAATQAIFATRRRRLSHERRTQEELIGQRQNELKELGLRLSGSRKSLELLASQVAISGNLLRGDLTSKMAHLELLRQQQTLRTLLDTDQAATARVEAALREARERLGTIEEGFVEQARTDLATATGTLDELSERALKYQNIEERTVLRAPVDGIVKTLSVSTEGGVVQPGQTVAEIVPVEDRLVIEAQLPIQDIGYVHAGQAVRIMLETPDAAAFGHIDGTVLTVSPDSIAIAGKYSFYKVRIETRQQGFVAGERTYRLYPGVRVLCSIRIGNRTVFEYLLSPWFRSLQFAFQER